MTLAAGDRATRGGRQLHVAETEKYPHVTYFFDGGEETPDDGRAARARAVAARRADVRPQARDERARGRARVRRSAWREDEPRFGIINFANAGERLAPDELVAMVRAAGYVDVTAVPRQSGRLVPVHARRAG